MPDEGLSFYDKPNVSGLDDFITSTREKFGARMFPINIGGLRQVFKSLERNELRLSSWPGAWLWC